MQRPATHVPTRPVGILILGRKRAGFDQEWSHIVCQRSIAALTGLGYKCIGGDAAVAEDEAIITAIDKMKQANCQALVMLQPSFAHGQLALTVSQHWTDPVVLWATPEKPGDGKASSNSLVGQHLWASALRQAGRPFELVYGDPDDTAVQSDLVRAIALSRTVAQLRFCKVGVVGTHAPGFIDLAADPFLLRRSMGIQLHPLSLPQYLERAQSMSEAAVEKDVQRVLKLNLPMKDVTASELAMNSRCYLAMLELMQEESLDALALQCWPEIPNMLGQWPYLAISRLTAEGYAVSIEGDVDGCVGSLINILLGLGPSFLTDWLEHDHSTIFLWHPGMAPMSMCNPIGEEDGPTLTNHFNLAKPYVVDGQIRSDEPVTITRLWRCDGSYHMTGFEGRTIVPRRKVTGNIVLVETTEPDVQKRFDRLLHAGMPHHVLLSFGTHAETFRKLARMLQVEWHA
jgi:L-fucose isomerase-like protein